AVAEPRPVFMPHLSQALRAERFWRLAAAEAGLGYVDPRWPVETVVAEIQGASLVVTEALHGAVIADTYRIPWMPVASHRAILAFKWQDWCRSVGLRYRPLRMLPAWHRAGTGSLAHRAKHRLKREIAVRRLSRERRRGGQRSPDRNRARAMEKLDAAFDRFIDDNS